MGAGDGGLTEFGGRRVSKDDPGLEALGQLDEFQACLALAAAEARGELRDGLMARVAETARAMEALAGHSGARPFPDDYLVLMEGGCARLRSSLRPSGFSVPGKDRLAALMNHARTVARRTERALWAAKRGMPVPPGLLAWANRVSEWLHLSALVPGDPGA